MNVLCMLGIHAWKYPSIMVIGQKYKRRCDRCKTKNKFTFYVERS